MNIQGLSKNEVESRISENKINKTNNTHTRSVKTIILSNIFTLFNGLNLILALLIVVTGNYRNMLFMITVLTNTVIGIIQELRAKKELDSLQLLIEDKNTVIRDNNEIKINKDEIVLDDVLLLRSGEQIPCDSIIIDGHIDVNEALITGEQDPISKKQDDQLLSGSYVLNGKAYARVNGVGDNSYTGKILNNIKVEKRQESRLRDALNFILKNTFIILIPLGIILFLRQFYFSKLAFNDSLTNTVAAMVGMMPEGLVLLTSVALTIGTLLLARENTLVKEMYSLETLARADVLCLDKTGTITTGNMQVEKVISYKEDINNMIANMINIINDDNHTSVALKDYFKIDKPIEYTSFENFNSKNKYSSLTINDDTYYLGAHESFGINNDDIKKYENEGYRVLSFMKNKELLGLIILKDEVRENAKEIIDYLKSQNVNIKIISGDNINTINNLLLRSGFELDGEVCDCSKMNEEELKEKALTSNIFGRSKPEDKKIIIDALKDNGHVVGMIGDGVNDALALKTANFSIAMKDGAESAKNIANVILVDNDFSHITSIINQGRRVINNIQRTATLFLTKTLSSMLISLLAIIYLKEYPFEPIQLTLVSSLCIGIPAFVLSLEPKYEKISGDFLQRVIGKVIPVALSFFITLIIIGTLNRLSIIDYTHNNTFAIFIFASILIVTIYRISKPLTFVRIFLLILSSCGILIGYIFLNELFFIELLNMNEIIICVVLCLINIGISLLLEKAKLIDKLVNKIDKAY